MPVKSAIFRDFAMVSLLWQYKINGLGQKSVLFVESSSPKMKYSYFVRNFSHAQCPPSTWIFFLRHKHTKCNVQFCGDDMIFFRSRFFDGVCQKAAVFQGSILTSLWITHDFQPKPSGHRQTPSKNRLRKKIMSSPQNWTLHFICLWRRKNIQVDSGHCACEKLRTKDSDFIFGLPDSTKRTLLCPKSLIFCDHRREIIEKWRKITDFTSVQLQNFSENFYVLTRDCY